MKTVLYSGCGIYQVPGEDGGEATSYAGAAGERAAVPDDVAAELVRAGMAEIAPSAQAPAAKPPAARAPARAKRKR